MHAAKPNALHPKEQRTPTVTIPELFQNAIAAVHLKKESSRRSFSAFHATDGVSSPVQVINLVDDHNDEPRYEAASGSQAPAANTSSTIAASSSKDLHLRPAASTASSTLPTFTPRVLKAGSFEIVLVLDAREVRRKNDRDYIASKLAEKGVRVLTRNLELGDVIWVARSNSKFTSENEDVVLDYVLERKRMDDLVCSIKDGRFREQKVSRYDMCGAD
jgi:hypothetical protein